MTATTRAKTRVVCPTCGRTTSRARRDDERGAFGICPRDGDALIAHPPPYYAKRAARARRELGGSRS
jgi:rRNA maturation protein Nop10